MFYRETGQFKTSYEADSAIFPILQDRVGLSVILFVAFVIVPILGYYDVFPIWLKLNTALTPALIFALAAVGLNILTGYAGQISLGTGAFMGVGAYACYKLTSIFPDVNIIFFILFSGFFSAAIGLVFGLPSLRIKGFYIVVTTLAAQFFLEWAFIRIQWLYNYNDSGAIEVPEREVFGHVLTGASASPVLQYFVVLSIVVVMTWIASNLIRGRIGRSWMMIRDMDIAAELMGVRPLIAKLSAFSVSSFYCGVAGAMMVFLWLNATEPEAYDINLSFQILFMVILGGGGSLLGCFLGAAFIWIFPLWLKHSPGKTLGLNEATVDHISFMIVGALILFFLIVEPHGLARLWQIGKEKLRTWPFPYS